QPGVSGAQGVLVQQPLTALAGLCGVLASRPGLQILGIGIGRVDLAGAAPGAVLALIARQGLAFLCCGKAGPRILGIDPVGIAIEIGAKVSDPADRAGLLPIS